MFGGQGRSRLAALWSLSLAVALSGTSGFAQTWDWTVHPASPNRADSQPDTLSPPDARGFWSFGTSLVHYHPDGSLDVVGNSPGVPGGSLAATLSDGSLIVGTPSHEPEISFGGLYTWCFVTAYSPQGVPRWTQQMPAYGPCAQLVVDTTDTIWVRTDNALGAISADGVMRDSSASPFFGDRWVSDIVTRPQGGVIAAVGNPAGIVSLDANLNPLWVADDAAAATVYDQVAIGSDGNVFALGRASGDVAGAALHVSSVTATGTARFALDIDTIKTDAVLAASAALDGGLYVLSNVAQSTNVAVTHLAADGTVAWNQIVGGHYCGFYLPVCPLVVTTQGDLLFGVESGDHWDLHRIDANGQALQSTAFAENISSLTALANGDALVARFDSFNERGIGLARFDRSGVAQPSPPTSGLVPDTAYVPAVLESNGDSFLAVSDASGYALMRVDSAGVTQWQTARFAGHHSYRVDHGGNRVCVAEYGDESPFAANCFAADTGASAAMIPIDPGPARFLPQRVLDDGALLTFDFRGGPPQHVLFDANGALLHRTVMPELGFYSFDLSTRDYISAKGTAVVMRSDGSRLAAYDRNGVRLYDIEVPEQLRTDGFNFSAIHVFPDGGAVLTSDHVDGNKSTLYAWRVNATGATQWLQALTPPRQLAEGGYSFSNVFAAGAGDVLYFATSGIGYPAALQARSGATGQLLWEQANLVDDIYGAVLSVNPATGDLALTVPGSDKLRLLAIDGATGAVRKQTNQRCSNGSNAGFCTVVDASVSADDTLRVLATSSDGPFLAGLGNATGYAQLVRVDQPGIAGAWYPIYSAGQGFTLDYIASANTVFMPWFTFSQEAVLDPSGLAWFALQGGTTNGATGVDLAIARTEPGVFNSGSVTAVTVGSAHLNFTDCNNATLFYQFNAGTNGGDGGLITLTRLTPNTSSCIEGDGSTTPAQIASAPANGFDARQSGSWYDPATSGQGLEMTIIPGGGGSNGLVFAAWFTFDPAGRSDDPIHQHWFTLQGDLANATSGTVTLPIYRIIGGTFDGTPTQNYSLVGHATLTMQACDKAQLDYQFDTTEVTHAFAGLSGTSHLVKIGGCSP